MFLVYFFFVSSFLLCFVVTNSFADENHRNIVWEDLDHGLLKGREKLKTSLVYAQTKGCGPCSLIEMKIFPQLQSIMEQLVLIKIDFNDRSTRIRIGDTVSSPFEWARYYNLYATPGFALIDSKGKNILSDSPLDLRFFNQRRRGCHLSVTFLKMTTSTKCAKRASPLCFVQNSHD